MKGRGQRCLAVGALLGLLGAAARLDPSVAAAAEPRPATVQDSTPDRCAECHSGIEAMHPEAGLTCVDCHGGDASASSKFQAHVQPRANSELADADERVADPERDLAWRRFKNPMDLRVAERTCGACHEDEVRRVHTSLHGTTAGHLSDGYYEMGLVDERGSRYGVFAVPERLAEPGDVSALVQVPPHDDRLPRDRLASHYTDLARKECMQCHLWSEGRAVRGRVGFDGDYRGEGCAACHVAYAVDGLSETSDRSLSRTEPGHPLRHEMTRAPATATCTTCHYGDASIGLNFRGLSQLPPGAPGGPEIPGTTDTLLNRAFYVNDPALTPPDVHHERGMHCIDCHTMSDVMGDGRLYGAMERAVEISCSDCHGTFDAPARLHTQRGTPLAHLQRRGERVVLVSKVDGREHDVTQVAHVLDPERPEFNERAAAAMTGEHARLECYACHAAWNVNFLGFHFDRNESLTQLDLLSGARTRGRVTTQEKVFATWKSFYAGWNEGGRVAPYLTGFSTMGSVSDVDGERILDQVMPETAAGLSGMTMIHHQMHTNRKVGRSCIDCHRSSAAWGLGSVNFRLGRALAFVADRRGLEVLALDRAQLAASTALAKFVLPDIVDVAIASDDLQGRAQFVFAAEGGRGIHVLDVRDPTAPERVAFVASIEPQGLALGGDILYCADGIGGLRVYDASEPEELRLVGALPTFDARAVALQWPYAYVADGPGGLAIVDVRAPIAPRLVGGLRLSDKPELADRVVDVEVLFQYSRPLAAFGKPADYRTQGRLLAALVDERAGLVLVDVTEPAYAFKLWPDEERSIRSRQRGDFTYRGLALASHVDLAEPQGGTQTDERDYVYLLRERRRDDGEARSDVAVMDVTDADRPELRGRAESGYATEMLELGAFYNAPFLQTVLFAAGEQGVLMTDVTTSAEPAQLGAVAALRQAYVVRAEAFALDRMRDEQGRALKDVSHRDSRWLYLAEIERVLGVSARRLGVPRAGASTTEIPGQTARLFLQELDRNRSGLLDGEEFDAARAFGMDENGDRRMALGELAAAARLLGAPDDESRVLAPTATFREQRLGEDGDLARLLDGVNPYAFDEDDDGRLSREETESAFFAALDLDTDRRVGLAELSRHPGELRQLRYQDAAAQALFDARDVNRDGRITRREFHLADRDWEVLDGNRDGALQLASDVDPWLERRGFVGPQSEWPTRQPQISALPPRIETQTLLETFDGDGDGRLSQKELRRRPDLMRELDGNSDGRVEPSELDVRVNFVGRYGVDVTADGFTARWDLDGDGRVGAGELPEGVLRLCSERRSRR